MKNVLIVDTETTGLDPSIGCQIIELASVLYSVEYKTILQQFSTLLPCRDNPQYSINRINVDATKFSLDSSHKGLLFFESMIDACDYIVAHNAEFDKSFLEADIMCMPSSKSDYFGKKWIDTCDFEWPEPLPNGKSLINVALSLGVPVISAHRALTDCLLIASCFDKIDNLQDKLIDSLKERFIYKAMVSFDHRHLAKNAGFAWDRFNSKSWTKRLTEEESLLNDFPFIIQKIEVN